MFFTLPPYYALVSAFFADFSVKRSEETLTDRNAGPDAAVRSEAAEDSKPAEAGSPEMPVESGETKASEEAGV